MCAQMTLETDASDATAMIEVICATVDTWPARKSAAFEAEFDRLLDEDRLVRVQIGGPGRIEVDAHPDLLALMARWRIGEVMA